MRNCYCLDHNLKQRCEVDLGGIDKIYFINLKDFVKCDGEKIYLKEGTSFYELDFANNMARLNMETVNTNDQSYVLSTLTFTMRFETVNLEDELKCLQLGYFKALVRYKNGYWRFIDEDPLFFFKQNSIVHDSGQTDVEMNQYSFEYVEHGHTWGYVYEDKPEFVVSKDTDPNWVIIDEKCETTGEEHDKKPIWEIIDTRCEEE